jgi:superfamily II DNA/RNA helicase
VATLARSLERHGFDAGALHGDMDQKSRTETLDRFRGGRLKFLIASDVAARGLDIPAVSHVLNFDVPTHAEDYVHRIGRTGRAGRSGTSITLAQPSDGKYIDAIEKLIHKQIPVVGKSATEGGTEEVAEEAPPRERRGRGGRNRTPRARQEHQDEAAAPLAEQPREPQPEQPRAARPERQRERQPERQPELALAEAAPRKSEPPRKRGSESPFGDEGPVPAFLLRPGRVG